MGASNIKWLYVSLVTIGLLGGYFYYSESQENHEVLKISEPAADSSIPSTAINQVEVQAKAEQNPASKVSSDPLETNKQPIATQISQVPIPSGAVSLETMIANFEQEKKKASEASHESPFKPLQ